MEDIPIKAEGDLLHPLSTLNWELCYTSGDTSFNPTHCAALHDKIAVLNYFSNKIHISSTDLKSWTTFTTPYQSSSLTTYQSKFVLIGGYHPLTDNDVTNKLWTSTTGLDWDETSLPAMNTNRYWASSVSGGSPAILIVTGGKGPDDNILDVVEVLLNNHWITVESLPTPCYNMRSTLHRGNFYITGGHGKRHIIYTCSCNSIIASANGERTNGQSLWGMMTTLHATWALVSYSSRLTSIDKCSVIRGYSNTSQTWVETTNAETIPETSTYVSAAVISSGQLVTVYRREVYKRSLSVSIFYPDTRFIPNVLARLEAVMGVQIVSVLATACDKLTSTSGVVLQTSVVDNSETPLPDPHTDPVLYVQEVVAQWSMGNSNQSPTWRKLLQVIQTIGLIELKEQIESFLKNKLKEKSAFYSTSEMKQDAASVKHVDNVKVTTVNNVKDNSRLNNGSSVAAESISTSSPTSQTSPSQNSSQATSSKAVPHKDRNLKENLHEDQVNPEKEHFFNDVTAALLKKQSIRRKVANLLLQGLPGSGKTSLLDRLLNRPFLAYYSSTGICERIVIVEIGHASMHASAYTCEDNTWKVTDFDESIISQLDSCKVFISRDTRENPQLHLQHQEVSARKHDHAVFDIDNHVKQVLQKHNIKNITDLQTKNSLYIRDTGGQIEFQENLTLLIFGPSIFIFAMKTNVDINAKHIIQYRSSNKKSINQYESSISTMDALIQFLTSVSAIQTTEKSIFEVDGTSVCHEPVVFIVGTHIDKLGPEARSILDNINKMLHQMIVDRNFDLIRYANRHLSKVMYEIDNTCNDDQHFQQLRSDINKYIRDRSEFLVEYPVSYLLFCLELQSIKETVLSIDKCKKLAAKFYIQESEIPSLLNFLHFRVGIIQYYNVPGISDLIIKEPQVLFNKVTELILETFLSSGSATSIKQDQFVQKGILEVSAFKHLLTSKDEMTPEQFLLFLLHLRVAVPFTDRSGTKKYFIPSVLNHVEMSPSDIFNTDIAPLAITFRLGHCPKCLLGMLISFLLSPDEHQDVTFDLLEDQIYQDQVSLLMNYSRKFQQICLKGQPSHLEVHVLKENSQPSDGSNKLVAPKSAASYEVYCKLRQTLENCLELSFQKLHYDSSKVGATFSLKCLLKQCGQFHEVCYEEQLYCKKNNCQYLLPESGSIWFNKVTENKLSLSSPQHDVSDTSVSESKVSFCEELPVQVKPAAGSTSSQNPEFSMKSLTLLKWTDKDGKSQTLRLRNEMSSSWRDVGVSLGLSMSRINGIKTYYLGDVRPCCSDVLQDWLQDGSSDYPASWEGLLHLLEDVELNSLKDSLEDALKTISKS